MEQNLCRKRQFIEDDNSDEEPMKKRVRFPKSREVKPEKEALDKVEADNDVGLIDLKDRRHAVKEHANFRRMEYQLLSEEKGDQLNDRPAAIELEKRQRQLKNELLSEEKRGRHNDVFAAEVTYEINENFVDDGIQMEPFNLEKEREEGYFDAQGNFVEYVNDNKIKDAWLDSLEIDQRYVGTAVTHKKNDDNDDEDDSHELSSEDLGVIKRRIANVLEPGETVMQALRRLKGTSNNKKEKMSAETKRVFDQLTEDAMKLMEENGEYNVYHEKRETFEREAEGYERLALSRGKRISGSVRQGNLDSNAENYLYSDITNPGSASLLLPGSTMENGSKTLAATETASDAEYAYDMFADDDDSTAKPAIRQSSSDALNSVSEGGSMQNDYVYDESSGYYYSSSLGYYYDPSTGLYCAAATGQWYSFNKETGTYEEVNELASSTN